MTLANWRDLAVVLLVLQAFLLVLIPGIVLFFAIRGMSWARRKLTSAAPVVQDTFRKVATISDQTSRRVAGPLIAADAALAAAELAVRAVHPAARRAAAQIMSASEPGKPGRYASQSPKRGVNVSSRNTAIIIGGAVGAVLGATAAWAYTQTQQGKLPAGSAAGKQLHLQAGAPDYVKVATMLVGLVRQVVDLFKLA